MTKADEREIIDNDTVIDLSKAGLAMRTRKMRDREGKETEDEQ